MIIYGILPFQAKMGDSRLVASEASPLKGSELRDGQHRENLYSGESTAKTVEKRFSPDFLQPNP